MSPLPSSIKYKRLLYDKNTYLSLLGIIAILYLFVVTFPGAFHPIGVGLDPSWHYGLNYLNYSSRIFGRDVVFTYGPLGYLLNPVNLGSNIIQAILFRLLLHVLLVGILFYYLLKRRKALPVIIFTAAYLVAFVFGIGFSEDEYEYTLVVSTGLLTSVSALEDPKTYRLGSVLNGFLASSFLFMKFSTGISSLAIITVSSIFRLINKKPTTSKSLFATAVAYFSMTIIIGTVYFKSPNNFLGWLKGSFDIADGYNVAMSQVGPPELLIHALVALATYSSLLFLLYLSKARSLDIALALCVPIFLCFKQGFVRQDGHMLIFYPFLVAAIGIVILNTENWRELAFSGVSLVIVAALAIPVANKFEFLRGPRVADKLWASEGRRHIRSLYYLNDTRRELDRQSWAKLEADRIPVEWANLINANDSRVGTLPWEISYCAANGLLWDPFPTLQMYTAYKSALDEWAAKHYAEKGGPGFLLLDFIDIDQRNLLLDAPATWRSILRNYEIIRKHSPQGLSLLQKRDTVLLEALEVIGEEEANITEWVTVPPVGGLLYAFIEFRLNVNGWVRKAAFDIPPTKISFLLSSGKTRSYRIIPDTAQNGLLINFSANDMVELNDLFSHKATDKVLKFRVSGPGVEYYHKTSRLTWKEDQNYKVSFSQEKRVDLSVLQLVNKETFSAIDVVNTKAFPLPPVVTIDSNSEDTIKLSGWAVDFPATKPAAGVFLDIDGKTDVPATYGQDRNDVALALKNSEFRFSGFTAFLPTDQLEKGLHTVSLKVLTFDKKAYYQSPKITIEIK